MAIRVGILTSGGDCPGLNATLRGVAKALYHRMGDKVEIVGIMNGYDGLINGNFREMSPDEFSGILTVGGTILGTKRTPFKKMRVVEEDKVDKVAAMKKNYRAAKLDCLLCLGGNGTHKTANLLSQEGLNIIGLPKTIDNDLYGTDHCPGYASAAKYIATSFMEVYLDSHVYDTGMVVIMEIMGRQAGGRAAAAALASEYGAGPDLIYLPETDFDMPKFINDVKGVYAKKGNCLVAVSEGIHYADGGFVSEAKVEKTDGFGHAQMGGLASILVEVIKEEMDVKVRGIELNLLQRCGAHLASETDIEESFMAGKAAVENAIAGINGRMIAFERGIQNGRYACKTKLVPLMEVANVEKKIPRSWINEDGTGVNHQFIEYALPLIQGEPDLPKQDSLPRFAKLKKILAK